MLRILILSAVILSITSCSKHSEQDDLASAQACLDNLPVGDYAGANACLAMTKDYTSQQAEILKCSIIITSGGVMEDKIITAYNAFKDSTQTNKTAAYMAALALTYPDVDTGYTKALEADPHCQATNINGFKYLSGLIVAGSFMAKVTGGAIDVTNPNAAQTAINTLIANCVTTPQASCTDNIGALGASVTSLAGSYCGTNGADPNVCSQVNSAVGSGTSSSDVGQAMLCYLNGKTYSTTDHLCH
jgi:hypothetical protein